MQNPQVRNLPSTQPDNRGSCHKCVAYNNPDVAEAVENLLGFTDSNNRAAFGKSFIEWPGARRNHITGTPKNSAPQKVNEDLIRSGYGEVLSTKNNRTVHFQVIVVEIFLSNFKNFNYLMFPN
jgi:hypothetical protein